MCPALGRYSGPDSAVSRVTCRNDAAVDERLRTEHGQRQPLLCEDGYQVLDEVVFVLGSHLDPRLPAVEQLRAQAECTGQELALLDSLGCHDRQPPHGRGGGALRIADDVATKIVLLQLDG